MTRFSHYFWGRSQKPPIRRGTGRSSNTGYGRHLIRKQVSVTFAPGGVGKSSLTICEALAVASERELPGDWTAKGLKVWLYNLEDPRDEMDRR